MCLSCDCVSISDSGYAAAMIFYLNTNESSIAYEILTRLLVSTPIPHKNGNSWMSLGLKNNDI